MAALWCDGSQEEYDRLCQQLVDAGTFKKLNPAKRPGSYLAWTDPSDVARVEDRTFICSERRKTPARPTTGWRPAEMRATLHPLFDGCMRGPHDVRGAVLDGSARLAHRPHRHRADRQRLRGGEPEAHDPHGQGRLRRAGQRRRLRAVHAHRRRAAGRRRADVPWPCNPTTKYIVHYPETREIWSYGSGYGGNALLGKKCLALRIASTMGATRAGWPSTC
jgi:phosphoenolpyruvate carboxykinase (GTP)